jgi:1,4-dihydroxy-2-naphthoate octaprenyltransferase
MNEAVRRLPPATLGGRLYAYARLAKLGVYQHWAPVLVAWSLLEPPLSARAWAVLGLFLLSALLLAAAGAALDDVQGARDGLDEATYRPAEGLRRIDRKPLLLGELTEDQAVRFGRRLAVLGVVAGVAAVAVAPHRPLWLMLVFLVGGLAGVQYAYGLKLSYAGGGEWLLGILTTGTVTIPVALITGVSDWTTALTGMLIGWLFVQVTLFSNTADAEPDRAANRLTIAARLSPRANKRYIAAVFVAGWALVAAGLSSGELPPLLGLTLIPVWVLQLRQLWVGLGREQWLHARALGWRAFDLGLVAAIVANVADRAL